MSIAKQNSEDLVKEWTHSFRSFAQSFIGRYLVLRTETAAEGQRSIDRVLGVVEWNHPFHSAGSVVSR